MAAEFEFQGTAHRNARDMHDAIAEEWLSAGGTNTVEDIEKLLRLSDDSLADDAANGFGLDGHPAFNCTALREAFSRVRISLENRFLTD